MKFNETKKVGLDILLINVILLLFLYSKDGLVRINLVLASFSSLVAVLLNIYFVYKGAKTKINKIFLGINILIFLVVVGYTIMRFI